LSFEFPGVPPRRHDRCVLSASAKRPPPWAGNLKLRVPVEHAAKMRWHAAMAVSKGKLRMFERLRMARYAVHQLPERMQKKLEGPGASIRAKIGPNNVVEIHDG